jgi:hypothetical protein
MLRVGKEMTKVFVYLNHYRCPYDLVRWSDPWSCMCNGKCPTCGAEIEPYASHDVATCELIVHAPAVYDAANESPTHRTVL